MFQAKKHLIAPILVAFGFLVLALVVNFYAVTFATETASSSVTDVILSNTRVYDVDGIFVYGSVIFWVIVAGLCFVRPERLPFVLKSTALFIVIRSVFITLTHIGPFPTHLIINPDNMWIGRAFGQDLFFVFFSGNDLFFSGHTGLPFLMALLFWAKPFFRWLFTALALMFGVIVLAAHLHYTIDVLSAFFITYAIYHIARQVFVRDLALFESKDNEPRATGQLGA